MDVEGVHLMATIGTSGARAAAESKLKQFQYYIATKQLHSASANCCRMSGGVFGPYLSHGYYT